MPPDTTQDVLTSDSVSVVGKKPMVRRTFYVPKALWEQAKALADEAETDISTVVRELLERYVKKGKR